MHPTTQAQQTTVPSTEITINMDPDSVCNVVQAVLERTDGMDKEVQELAKSKQ